MKKKNDKVTHDTDDTRVFLDPRDYIKPEDKDNIYREQAKRIIKKQKKNK